MAFRGILAGWALFLVLVASQLFWFGAFWRLTGRLAWPRARRRLVAIGVFAVYAVLFLCNMGGGRQDHSPVSLTWRAALVQGPFLSYLVCSFVGFIFGFIFLTAGRIVTGAGDTFLWLAGKRRDRLVPGDPSGPADPPSATATGIPPAQANSTAPKLLGRRRFLEQAAYAVGSVPFFAGTYGAFYGRLNLKITHQDIWLRRLPKAFDGFRISQLSDIHIGPFMTEAEVRKYADLTNSLKADLIALTGDFVTWDASTQFAAVNSLSGLRAPYGVYGCLGNHEAWTGTEASITKLFAGHGFKMLRGENALLRAPGGVLNLIGVDFQTARHMGPHSEHVVRQYLEGVEKLLRPDTANILMSHNPVTFDRAALLGVDLSLAGHTHGGQVTMDFVSPYLSPSWLITRYEKGWFRKSGGQQLYVNRGIGTIFVPMRFAAPPEITVYTLRCEA
jgi:uncharacterized protein